MCYREPLPDGCPPGTASEIAEERQVYRLVESDPPTDDDFASLRALNPTKGPYPKAETECRACGLSVFPERAGVESLMNKLPHLRGLKFCVVRLTAGAGRIQHTGPGGHHTWWPLADFDILPQCTVEEDP